MLLKNMCLLHQYNVLIDENIPLIRRNKRSLVVLFCTIVLYARVAEQVAITVDLLSGTGLLLKCFFIGIARVIDHFFVSLQQNTGGETQSVHQEYHTIGHINF